MILSNLVCCVNYGDGDFAVIGARFAETNFGGGSARDIVPHEFFTADNGRLWNLGIEINTEDKVILRFGFEMFLHHEATTMEFAVVTNTVGEGRAVTARLGITAGKFQSHVHGVASSICHRLEKTLESTLVPFFIDLVDQTFSGLLHFLSVRAFQQTLGADVLQFDVTRRLDVFALLGSWSQIIDVNLVRPFKMYPYAIKYTYGDSSLNDSGLR